MKLRVTFLLIASFYTNLAFGTAQSSLQAQFGIILPHEEALIVRANNWALKVTPLLTAQKDPFFKPKVDLLAILKAGRISELPQTVEEASALAVTLPKVAQAFVEHYAGDVLQKVTPIVANLLDALFLKTEMDVLHKMMLDRLDPAHPKYAEYWENCEGFRMHVMPMLRGKRMNLQAEEAAKDTKESSTFEELARIYGDAYGPELLQRTNPMSKLLDSIILAVDPGILHRLMVAQLDSSHPNDPKHKEMLEVFEREYLEALRERQQAARAPQNPRQ